MPMAECAALVSTLFDCCVSYILRSPHLLVKASLHLPSKIGRYLLYEACEAGNLVAVQKLIETWPHDKLSFNFLSNSICLSRKEASSHCLEPHEYYGIFPTDQYGCCIQSIAIGVFHNVRNHLLKGNQSQLEEIDLSQIRSTSTEEVEVLCKLASGEFPGKHSSDYLSSKDAQKLGSPGQRPQLISNSSSHRIKLYVNIRLASRSALELFTEASSQSEWFQVVLRGLDLTELGPKHIYHAMHTLYLEELEDLLLVASSFVDVQPQFHLPKPLTLWLNTRFGLSNIHSHTILQSVSGFLCVSDTSDLEQVFHLVAKKNLKVLCLFRSQSNSLQRKHIESLAECLLNLSESLIYLQLRSWHLTSMPMDVLTLCRHLRILSITESLDRGNSQPFSLPLYTVSDVFNSLSQLIALEYFEWTETINMRTIDLLSLRRLLLDAVPHLQHWHISLSYLLLSTVDLENEDYAVLDTILVPLLEGKTGDESCTTYRFSLEGDVFRSWVHSLRPGVCFRIGKDVLYRSHLQFMY